LRSAAGDVRHVLGRDHAGDATWPVTQLGQFSMSVRRPLGVVAGIAPFNSLFLLSMKKIAFALDGSEALFMIDAHFPGKAQQRRLRLSARTL